MVQRSDHKTHTLNGLSNSCNFEPFWVNRGMTHFISPTLEYTLTSKDHDTTHLSLVSQSKIKHQSGHLHVQLCLSEGIPYLPKEVYLGACGSRFVSF